MAEGGGQGGTQDELYWLRVGGWAMVGEGMWDAGRATVVMDGGASMNLVKENRVRRSEEE